MCMYLPCVDVWTCATTMRLDPQLSASLKKEKYIRVSCVLGLKMNSYFFEEKKNKANEIRGC